MDLAVAMLDPEFRAEVEDLEAACNDPEQSAAVQRLLDATQIADTLEDVIEQAQIILKKAADGGDMNTFIHEGDLALAAGEKRAANPPKAAKVAKNDDVDMSRRKGCRS